MRPLTEGELLSRFIDKWQEVSPETYASLWYEDVSEEDIIADLVEVYGKSGLYSRIFNMIEGEAWDEGKCI